MDLNGQNKLTNMFKKGRLLTSDEHSYLKGLLESNHPANFMIPNTMEKKFMKYSWIKLNYDLVPVVTKRGKSKIRDYEANEMY